MEVRGDAGTQGPSLVLPGGCVQPRVVAGPRAEIGAPKLTAQCSEYVLSGCRISKVLMSKNTVGRMRIGNAYLGPCPHRK